MTEATQSKTAGVLAGLAALAFIAVALISGLWYWWLIALVWVGLAVYWVQRGRRQSTTAPHE
ncbi:hypothetical protein [Actinomycetospora termitidis]|uniref:Integral membrane protein n=1 Tax=Actinomycetospora termitidis TaxID=3053470 RepID=A0ABT7M596_9PSEU|nr:hypothetical protein [Actinomycetospora sp. Odt1-22]MDL5154618.1 hypothetical protein [Actinomycetospora sp. Odt1-22]